MSAFIEVGRTGGRPAAKQLGLGAGSVSEVVQRLEDNLGVRLFERSTRSVALKAAGQRLFDQSQPAMTDITQALKEISDT